jgi:hypothetical protein
VAASSTSSSAATVTSLATSPYVPRSMACSREVDPCELPHIHLVTGAVGVVDRVEMAPGIASLLSVRVLADAVTCDSPMVHGLGAVLW